MIEHVSQSEVVDIRDRLLAGEDVRDMLIDLYQGYFEANATLIERLREQYRDHPSLQEAYACMAGQRDHPALVPCCGQILLWLEGADVQYAEFPIGERLFCFRRVPWVVEVGDKTWWKWVAEDVLGRRFYSPAVHVGTIASPGEWRCERCG